MPLDDQTLPQPDSGVTQPPVAAANSLAEATAANDSVSVPPRTAAPPNPLASEATAPAAVSIPAPAKETVKGLGPSDTLMDAKSAVALPHADIAGTVMQDLGSQHQSAQISKDPDQPPTVRGYRLSHKLGQGTYGVVWKGVEDNTGTQVAVKFFHRRGSQSWDIMEAEIKQLAELKGDPGIIQIFDADLAANPPFFVMDYAEQGCLSHKLKYGPLPVNKALEVFRQVVEAMAYVHDKGIRHCDLKPGNILLDSRGQARVADFGQAHLSIDVGKAHLGTFFYMPPDQAEDVKQIADTRWDVYALGALFFRMVVGRPPRHDGPFEEELARTLRLESRLARYRDYVVQAPPPTEHRYLKGMDRPLADIIDRCLEIDPARRFHNAGDVLQALEQRERRKRLRPLLIFGALAPLLLLGALGYFAYRMINTAVQGSEQSMVEQVLSNDKVAAQLAAKVLEDKLDQAFQTIDRFSTTEKLAKLLQAALADPGPEPRQALDDHIKRLHGFSGYQYVTWTVFDSRGKLLSCAIRTVDAQGKPKIIFSESVRNKYFYWRDYFNREEDMYGRPDGPDAAFEFRQRKVKDESGAFVEVPYLSQPFRSRTVEDDSMFRCVAVSKSVVDPANPSKVLGVLLCSIKLSELHAWLDSIEQNSGGCAVVLDRRGYCLHHRLGRRDDAKLFPSEKEAPTSWTLDPELKRRGFLERHADPIDDGMVYLAAYRPVEKYGLQVVVEHRRDQALAGVAELRSSLITSTWTAGAISAAFLSAFWGWLLWLLLRKESVVRNA